MKVIKVGATWCNGCLVMKPRWKEIEDENPWLETEFYDFDENPEIIESYGIDENLPVAIFLDEEGNELKRLNGEVDKDELLKTLEAFRAK
jgi:thiol-disulfide isomerase/thioredoxin